jgi:hypothetical protein
LRKKQVKKKTAPRSKAEKGRKWVPNSRQIAIAELLANPEDRRTKGEKIKSIGLPERTFYKWMKDVRFIGYLNGLIEQYTDSELSEVWRSHMLLIKRGNVEAIKLYHQLKGNLQSEAKIKAKITQPGAGEENNVTEIEVTLTDED